MRVNAQFWNSEKKNRISYLIENIKHLCALILYTSVHSDRMVPVDHIYVFYWDVTITVKRSQSPSPPCLFSFAAIGRLLLRSLCVNQGRVEGGFGTGFSCGPSAVHLGSKLGRTYYRSNRTTVGLINFCAIFLRRTHTCPSFPFKEDLWLEKEFTLEGGVRDDWEIVRMNCFS